jgi:ribosomal subunit interface protein
MRIQIRSVGVRHSSALEAYARNRVQQHLGRFGPEVGSVTVRFADENGPRGGVDKRCRITVNGPRLGEVNFTETHADLFAAVDLGLDRLSHSLGRHLDRARELRSRPAAGDVS